MALGSAITNAVNKVKSSLGLSSVNNTGNINTSTSQTAGTPANAIGSGGAKQVVNAQKKQDDAYNTWANEQVIAGLRNNTYIGGSAVAAGNMYGSNKNFAGNVITNKDLTNSSNQKAIDKMNRFNQRVGRNETFAVVDGKTTPLTQRTVYVIDGVTGMKPPTSLKGLNSTSYSIFTTPGGSVVTQKSDGNLTASSNIPNSPQLSGVARYGRNDGNTLQGFISESPIGNTNIAQTAVRYLTGNQGEFGYTNKDYDTIYQNKDGTKWGGVKEAGTTLFNIGREAASGLATAGRYHLDKEAQGIVQNYVLGESQRETFDRNAAAHIREAYEGSSTVIHKNEKTGKEYIYVKNVKVPISVAERASADVYGGNAQFLGIKENGGDAYNWTNQ